MRSVAIVPTYNERENLSLLVPEVLEADQLDVLVVDDGSPDGTGELAERLGRETGRVRVLHRTGKQRLDTAYVEGFRVALNLVYERIVQMDADLSHRPEDLPLLLRAVETADVVIGSRGSTGRARGELVRHQAFGERRRQPLRPHAARASDPGRHRRLQVLPARGSGGPGSYRHTVERLRVSGRVNYLCHQGDLRISEVRIVFPDRVVGDSKMSWPILLEAAVLVLKLRYRDVRETRGESSAGELAPGREK
jgi:dolichol-phosphate mannosyltransferase